MQSSASALSGKVAVVIGGSRGIGRAIALTLAEAGACVVVVSRDAVAGQALVMQICGSGKEAHWLQGDYLDGSDMQRLAALVQRSHGSCDILIAGGGPGHPRPMPFICTPLKDYASFFHSRCIGRLYAIRAFADQMMAQGYGKTVLLTTDAGRVPTKSEVLNGAAAAALMFATRALARELAPAGVRINAVSTTLTEDTPSYQRFAEQIALGTPDAIADVFSRIAAKTPLGGLNTPEDVAQAVLFLAGPGSDRISGAILSVNGGLSTP